MKPRHIAQAGFTLIETMITLVVMAILFSVALPTYQSHQVSARRADCQASLVGFAQAMENHYSINYSYLKAAADGEDTGAPLSTLFPDQCPTSGTAHYDLEIESATASAFTLRATPISGQSQDGDGLFEINSLGQRFWDKNDDNDTGDSGENSWQR